MPFHFSEESSSVNNRNLVPAGTLAMAKVEVRGVKQSQKTHTRYADLQLKIEGGEFHNRVLFTNVNDPTERKYLPDHITEHSEAGRKMGEGAISRMVEAAGIVRVGDTASYERLNAFDFNQIIALLNGRTIAIKVGIEPGEGSYPDKNSVAAYLSPNPKSDGNKAWIALKEGKTNDAVHDATLAGGLASWKPPAGAAPNPAAPAANPSLLQGASWVQPPPTEPAQATGGQAQTAPATKF